MEGGNIGIQSQFVIANMQLFWGLFGIAWPNGRYIQEVRVKWEIDHPSNVELNGLVV